MHHVAIMKKSWGLIPKIISGEKTVESRWYKAKRTPWDKARAGDAVFFKNAGEPVMARAKISKVLQLEVKGLGDARRIIKEYGRRLRLVESDPKKWDTLPKYCILIFLSNPRAVKPVFNIDKRGFGTGAAWISVENIGRI